MFLGVSDVANHSLIGLRRVDVTSSTAQPITFYGNWGGDYVAQGIISAETEVNTSKPTVLVMVRKPAYTDIYGNSAWTGIRAVGAFKKIYGIL